MALESINKPVVVFGGTGHYGQQIVRRLLTKDVPVRVVSRSAEKARQTLGPDIQVVEGDITSVEVVREALEGAAAAVVAVAAMTRKLIKRREAIERDAVLSIVDEAEKAKLSRLVYISVYEIDVAFLEANSLLEMGKHHLAVEKRLAETKLNWTILGCSPSFEFFFTFLEKGAVPGRGVQRNPTISPEDLGEISAQAVLRDDLGGKRFRMTGPEALSFCEAADRIEKVTGCPIKYRHIPLGMVRFVSILAAPFTPFVRFIHRGMTLHDRFPVPLADKVPEDHKKLLATFNYIPVTFEQAVRERFTLT